MNGGGRKAPRGFRTGEKLYIGLSSVFTAAGAQSHNGAEISALKRKRVSGSASGRSGAARGTPLSALILRKEFARVISRLRGARLQPALGGGTSRNRRKTAARSGRSD
jgi:hypothetical protein